MSEYIGDGGSLSSYSDSGGLAPLVGARPQNLVNSLLVKKGRGCGQVSEMSDIQQGANRNVLHFHKMGEIYRILVGQPSLVEKKMFLTL